MLVQPVESASNIIEASSRPRPVPPYSSLTLIPQKGIYEVNDRMKNKQRVFHMLQYNSEFMLINCAGS